MIPVNCPCCEVPHAPHNTGCTYAADCPGEEADWAEMASLRREVMLLNRKVEGLKEWDDLSVRVNNEHVKTQAALRAEIAALQADVRRHRTTPREREAIVNAIASCEDTFYGWPADEGAADVLRNYLDRTAPQEVGRE